VLATPAACSAIQQFAKALRQADETWRNPRRCVKARRVKPFVPAGQNTSRLTNLFPFPN
jgi:hypothetical protein